MRWWKKCNRRWMAWPLLPQKNREMYSALIMIKLLRIYFLFIEPRELKGSFIQVYDRPLASYQVNTATF